MIELTGFLRYDTIIKISKLFANNQGGRNGRNRILREM